MADKNVSGVIETDGIKIEKVPTGSFDMEYFRFGGGGDVLVILPGICVGRITPLAHGIAKAYDALTDRFTVYVFDKRLDLPEGYTVKDAARDTAEALRAVGLSRVSIFGASMGGMMALVIAEEHPALVEKMVLGSTSSRVAGKGSEVIERWRRLADEGRTEELFLSFGEAIYPEGVFNLIREELIEASKGVTDEDLRRFSLLAMGVVGFDAERDIEKIICPTLVIGDRDDRVLTVGATERIKELRPDFEVFIYDGYGHAAYDVAPDYKERIKRFLVAYEYITPTPSATPHQSSKLDSFPSRGSLKTKLSP